MVINYSYRRHPPPLLGDLRLLWRHGRKGEGVRRRGWGRRGKEGRREEGEGDRGKKGGNHDERWVSFLLETQPAAWARGHRPRKQCAPISMVKQLIRIHCLSFTTGVRTPRNAQGASDTAVRSRYSMLQPVHKLRLMSDMAGTVGKGRVQQLRQKERMWNKLHVKITYWLDTHSPTASPLFAERWFHFKKLVFFVIRYFRVWTPWYWKT